MDAIGSDLKDLMIMAKLRTQLAKNVEILAINKDELTPANVEPFKIELIDTTPSYERPLRYNPTLTAFVTREVEALL